MDTSQEKSIDVLNSFLRGEISAVETYRQALGSIEQADIKTQLQTCMQSHVTRVDELSDQIRSMGGAPAEGSGVWGAFAKTVEGGAKALGDRAAVAALEEGEDHGRDDYRRDIDKLDAAARTFVESRLVPEQQRTHDAVSRLKKSLAS